jgi:hypothetical protein
MQKEKRIFMPLRKASHEMPTMQSLDVGFRNSPESTIHISKIRMR